eukprot:m.937000 g.937000  ORF g.937000 m.937000 type:complete len:128 (+) comp23812_c0_seq23:1299-1682(+)
MRKCIWLFRDETLNKFHYPFHSCQFFLCSHLAPKRPFGNTLAVVGRCRHGTSIPQLLPLRLTRVSRRQTVGLFQISPWEVHHVLMMDLRRNNMPERERTGSITHRRFASHCTATVTGSMLKVVTRIQ